MFILYFNTHTLFLENKEEIFSESEDFFHFLNKLFKQNLLWKIMFFGFESVCLQGQSMYTHTHAQDGSIMPIHPYMFSM